MTVTRYVVKLYSFSGADKQAFCKRLGAILGVDESEAFKLLDRAPIAVAEFEGKAAAEKLRDLIVAAQGLALLEETEIEVDEETEAPAPVTPPVQPLVFTEAEELPTGPSDDFRAHLWLVVLGVAVVLLVVLVLGRFISTYQEFRAKNQELAPVERPTEETKAEEPAPAPLPDPGKLIEDITAQERKLEYQNYLIEQKTDEIRSITSISEEARAERTAKRRELTELMREKEEIEDRLAELRAQVARIESQ